MFRDEDDHHAAARALELADEGVDVVEHPLRAGLELFRASVAREAVAVMKRNEVHESDASLFLRACSRALPEAKERERIGELLVVKAHVADRNRLALAFKGRRKARLVAQNLEEVVVFARMVHHDVLREAQGPQAVERFAFGPPFAVEVVVRGLPARAGQKPQRRRSRVGRRGIEVVEADVEARKERMVLELRRREVVVRKRADIEKQNVEGRILLRNPGREFRAALLFVGKERLVPFLHGLAVRHRLILPAGSAPVRRGDDGIVLAGVLRKKGVHHRRHRHADEAAERDEGDADRVPEKHVEKNAERAAADHLPVDEVEREFEDVVPREPGNAARVRGNAFNPREPAFAPEEHEGADDAGCSAQEPQNA